MFVQVSIIKNLEGGTTEFYLDNIDQIDQEKEYITFRSCNVDVADCIAVYDTYNNYLYSSRSITILKAHITDIKFKI